MVLGLSVLLSDHFSNSYPAFGFAVTVTEVPFSYSPPVVSTLPPLPAVMVSVYFTVGVGVGVSESVSLEQEITKKKRANNSVRFFIFQIYKIF